MAMTGAERQAKYMAGKLGDAYAIHRENVELKKQVASASAVSRENIELTRRLYHMEALCDAWRLSIEENRALLAKRDARIKELEELESARKARATRRLTCWGSARQAAYIEWCAAHDLSSGSADALLEFAGMAVDVYVKEPEAFSRFSGLAK